MKSMHKRMMHYHIWSKGKVSACLAWHGLKPRSATKSVIFLDAKPVGA